MKGANIRATVHISFEEAVFGCEKEIELTVKDDKLYFITADGKLERVGAVYRRISDEYLDPLAFEASSLLGIPGVFEAYKANNVAIINALGNGVADDKGIYPGFFRDLGTVALMLCKTQSVFLRGVIIDQHFIAVLFRFHCLTEQNEGLRTGKPPGIDFCHFESA